MPTLALGIGATSAVLSLIQGVVLKPPPYRRPQQLVLVTTARTDGQRMDLSVEMKGQARREIAGLPAGFHRQALERVFAGHAVPRLDASPTPKGS